MPWTALKLNLAIIRKLIEDEDSRFNGLVGACASRASALQSYARQETSHGENKVTQQFTIQPGAKTFQGKFTVPGDKSVSHRSIMFGAIAEGTRM